MRPNKLERLSVQGQIFSIKVGAYPSGTPLKVLPPFAKLLTIIVKGKGTLTKQCNLKTSSDYQ